MGDEQRFHLFVRLIDAGVTLFKWTLGAAVVAYAIYATKGVLIAFAGKDTTANVLIEMALKIQADRWVAYAVGIAGGGYGILQRNLRRRNIGRLTGHIASLERRIDPERTSSALNPDGTTRPEDK